MALPMKLIVGLDLDGVLFDWDAGWRKAYDLWFDAKLSDLRSIEWDLLPETHFKDYDQFYRWAQQANVFGNLYPLPGALGGVYTWLEQQIAVRIVTSRPDWAAGATAASLARFGLTPGRLGSNGIELVFDPEKWNAKADLYVDDSPEVLKGLKARGKTTVRFSQPWNKHVRATVVANNWSELTSLVLDMAGVVA